jgi:MbtH protein
MSENKSIFDDDNAEFHVVLNDEEQYSIWPANIEIPLGWRSITQGSKSSCLEHIKNVWSDMRPKSLRLAMGEQPATDTEEQTEPGKAPE